MTKANYQLYAALFLVLGLIPGLLAQETPPQQNIQPSAPAQDSDAGPETPTPTILTNYGEMGGSYLPLSNNFGHWSGGYGRGPITTDKHVLFGEMNGQHEFEDAGTYLAFGDTYTINSDWYGSLTVGSSVGGFFWPRFRMDAFINKKWLGRKQLISTVGFGYYEAKDTH